MKLTRPTFWDILTVLRGVASPHKLCRPSQSPRQLLLQSIEAREDLLVTIVVAADNGVVVALAGRGIERPKKSEVFDYLIAN